MTPRETGKPSILRSRFWIITTWRRGLATFPYTNGDAPYSSGSTPFQQRDLQGPGMHFFAPGFVSNSGISSYPYVLTNGNAYARGCFSINPLGAYPGATTTFGGFNYNANFALPTHNISQPYTDQWTLTVGRQLPGGMALTISYVGSQSHHLWNEQDLNPCQPTGYINGVPDWINSANANCPATNLTFPASHSCTYYLNNGSSYTQVVKTDRAGQLQLQNLRRGPNQWLGLVQRITSGPAEAGFAWSAVSELLYLLAKPGHDARAGLHRRGGEYARHAGDLRQGQRSVERHAQLAIQHSLQSPHDEAPGFCVKAGEWLVGAEHCSHTNWIRVYPGISNVRRPWN